MKRTQIMIIFVAVVFAGVCWAENNGSLHGNGSGMIKAWCFCRGKSAYHSARDVVAQL